MSAPKWPKARRVVPPAPETLMHPERWADSVEWMRAALAWLDGDPDRRLPVYEDGDKLSVIRASARIKIGKSLDCDCGMSDPCRCNPKVVDSVLLATAIPHERWNPYTEDESE